MDLGTIAGLISVVALPAAFGLGAMSLNSHRFARYMFWATAILAMGAVLMFQWDTGPLTPVKLLLNAASGAVIALCLSLALNWAKSKELESNPLNGPPSPGITKAPTMPPSSASGSSTEQQGGQTAGTINNYGPVYNAPTLKRAPAEEGILLPSRHSDMAQYRGALLVIMGNSVFKLTVFPATVISIDGKPILKLSKVSENHFKIDTLRIFDDRQDIILRIDNGDPWHVPAIRIKRPSSSEIVVFDHNDDMVLDLLYFDQNSIVIKSAVFRVNSHLISMKEKSPIQIDGAAVQTISHSLFENIGLAMTSDGRVLVRTSVQG
jgi:hypothetical protein